MFWPFNSENPKAHPQQIHLFANTRIESVILIGKQKVKTSKRFISFKIEVKQIDANRNAHDLVNIYYLLNILMCRFFYLIFVKHDDIRSFTMMAAHLLAVHSELFSLFISNSINRIREPVLDEGTEPKVSQLPTQHDGTRWRRSYQLSQPNRVKCKFNTEILHRQQGFVDRQWLWSACVCHTVCYTYFLHVWLLVRFAED